MSIISYLYKYFTTVTKPSIMNIFLLLQCFVFPGIQSCFLFVCYNFLCFYHFFSKIIQMNYKVFPKSISHIQPQRVMYWYISLSLPGDFILLLSGLAAFEPQCTGIDLSSPFSNVRFSLSYIPVSTFLICSFDGTHFS